MAETPGSEPPESVGSAGSTRSAEPVVGGEPVHDVAALIETAELLLKELGTQLPLQITGDSELAQKKQVARLRVAARRAQVAIFNAEMLLREHSHQIDRKIVANSNLQNTLGYLDDRIEVIRRPQPGVEAAGMVSLEEFKAANPSVDVDNMSEPAVLAARLRYEDETRLALQRERRDLDRQLQALTGKKNSRDSGDSNLDNVLRHLRGTFAPVIRELQK